jgi:UDP-glucose 4-epimerase
LALKKLTVLPQSEFINLGTNRGISVLEIIKITEEITGKKVEFGKKAKREGDVAVLLASNEKAKQLLEWSPRQSDINTIIETAWNWHKARASGKH